MVVLFNININYSYHKYKNKLNRGYTPMILLKIAQKSRHINI